MLLNFVLSMAVLYADAPGYLIPKYLDPKDNKMISDTVRERFNLPDWNNSTCHIDFPYENNLALEFTDMFHYRNATIPRPFGLGEWAGYYLIRKAENLWEGSNKGEHKLTNFNAREMTVQLRIAQDKGEDNLEIRFLSESALRNPTRNYSDVSWDHSSKDGWWNFMTGARPKHHWMKLMGSADNGYFETDPARSYILRVRGALQGIGQTTAWTMGKKEECYRIRLQYEEKV